MKNKKFVSAAVSAALVASVVAPIVADAATGKTTSKTNIKDIRLYSATKAKVYYSEGGKTVSKDITLPKPIKHLSTYGVIPWEGKNIRWSFNERVQLPQQKSYAKYMAQAKAAIERGDTAAAEASLALAKKHLGNMEPEHFSPNVLANYTSSVTTVTKQVEEIKVPEIPVPPVVNPTPPINPTPPVVNPMPPVNPTPPPVVNPTPPTPPTNPGTVQTVIESVQSEPGKVIVTLNQPTATAITKDAISILCNSGGSDMTVLNVTTRDNRVYEITTAYYKDNTYEIYMNLPYGTTTISKVFEVRTNAPAITKTSMERINEGNAEFFFESDSQGTFYYLLKEQATKNVVKLQEPVKMSNARVIGEASKLYSATTIDLTRQLNYAPVAGDPTAAEIKATGVKTNLKFQGNTLRIPNLKPDVAYTLYCLAVDEDGKESLVQGPINIAAKPEQTEKLSDITITEASATDRYFDITLSKAPSETLTLDHFSISCPLEAELYLGKVEKLSDTKYRVHMKENYFFVDRNNYKIIITYSDRTISKHTFYVDLSAPDISLPTVKRTSATSAEFDFKANEAGIMWYLKANTSDTNNNELGITIDKIVQNGTKVSFTAGSNRIKLDNLTEQDKSIWFVAEDELGNRSTFMDRYKIPKTATTPTPEQPDSGNTTTIKSITTATDSDSYPNPRTVVTITFNDDFAEYVSGDFVEISGNGLLFQGLRELQASSDSSSPNVATIEISKNGGTVLAAGKYTIKINFSSGAVTGEFTVPQP